MNMPERGEVPKEVIDKINKFLDMHQPPLDEEGRKLWHDRAIETYWEGVEQGYVDGQAEVELAALLSERVCKKLFDEIVSDEFRQAIQTGDASSPEHFKEIVVTLMQTAFMKGNYMRYLLAEKNVKNYEELFQLLIQKPETN